MALRVLLADESPTIKKVIQLALQDYSVEVKSVPIGLDVLPISKVFQPDIIFADVLLAKKSGYEVCKELKHNPETQAIPVILMWNSLMGLDEKKAVDSKADRRLEKPFEVETLRQMVQELTPKTVTNPISSFLKFTEIEDLQNPNNKFKNDYVSPAKKTQEPITSSKINLNDVSDIDFKFEHSQSLSDIDRNDDSSNEDFKQTPLHNAQIKLDLPKINTEDLQFDTNYADHLKLDLESSEDQAPDNWSQQKITELQMPSLNSDVIQIEDTLPDELTPVASVESLSQYKIKEAELENANFKVTENYEEVTFDSAAISQKIGSDVSQKINIPSLGHLPIDAEKQEQIIREETKKIVEKICFTLIPEIAERVVREEIKKILQEAEKSV